MNNKEKNLGFSDRFVQEATLYKGMTLARVTGQSKDIYTIATPQTDMLAEISGKLRFEAEAAGDFPAVGDFVMADRESGEGGNAIIHHILTRKSVVERSAAGTSQRAQIIAANVDTLFICMAMDRDFNLRRLERYLAVAWDGGVTPVVVLTKADLADDVSEMLREAETAAIGAEVIAVSSMQKDGHQAVAERLAPGMTVAFIGSSGVGKSTLINRLMGEEAIETGELRGDGKGRHTTTRRELLLLPGGGAVIDTPGMREIGLEHANVGKAFADIDALATLCRFADCKHKTEPGCAVQAAIEAGELTPERLKSYEKLKREAKYQSLDSNSTEREKLEIMFEHLGGFKAAKKMFKQRNKQDKYKG